MKHALPLLALLALTLPAAAQARPVSATLYPEGAMVTEEETFRPEGGRVLLALPSGADAGSLSFSLASGRVLESRLVEKNVPSPAMKALQNELEKVRAELSRVDAERESVSFERLFWADPPLNLEAKDRKALDRQAKETQSRLAALAERDANLEARRRELEQSARALEKRMEALGRGHESVQECALFLEGTEGGVSVRWTYFLPGASWQPRYRVAADEKAGKVRVAMDAVLRQSSGTDWKGVDIALSSSEDFRSVNPPSLPDWIIGEERPVMRSMNLMASKSMAAEGAVQGERRGAGMLWKLGAVDIPAEGSVTRPVASHELSASFVRLVRPAQDTRAWIAAALTDENMPLLPSGEAVFSVDGVESARGPLRLGPGSKDLFFGVDQLVTAKRQELPAKAGDEEKKGQRTRQWRQSMDIANGHGRQIAVRVEVAAPITRDPSMSVAVASSPKAAFEEESGRHVWRLDIPAGQSERIVHEVTVTEPEKTAEAKNGA